MDQKRITQQVRIEKETHKKLKRASIEAGSTMSVFLTALLETYFKDQNNAVS
jgi:predicted DNA-binding protein